MSHISTFRIPIDKIPQAKNWKVGGRYQIIADVEQTGVNKERDYSDEPLSISTKPRKEREPRYKTMVEFKICDVSAKGEALRRRISK